LPDDCEINFQNDIDLDEVYSNFNRKTFVLPFLLSKEVKKVEYLKDSYGPKLKELEQSNLRLLDLFIYFDKTILVLTGLFHSKNTLKNNTKNTKIKNSK